MSQEGMAAGSRFDAQIVDDVSGLPINNAHVTLDLSPAGGDAEYSADSETFGFLAVTDIAAGTYTLRVEKFGYTAHEEPVTFDGMNGRNAAIRLAPIEVNVTFDVHFQINGAISHAALAGAQLRAEYWRPDGDLSGAADQVYNLIADASGFATLAGVRDGFYTFSVTKTGWMTLRYEATAGQGFVVSDGKVRLIRSHFAVVEMKPVTQDVRVKIMGFDPVANKAGPLKGMTLMLTGIDPNGKTLLPTRSAVSRKDGTYTFPDMPPIDYRLNVGRLGYQPEEVIIVPNVNALFPNVETVTIDLIPRRIKASLSSIYQSTKPLEEATIRLQGILGSNTEGINRTNIAAADTNFTASAIFANLIPGRYWLHVKHEATVSDLPNDSGLSLFFTGPVLGPSSFSVSFFPRETYAEVGTQTEEYVEMDLDPIPAIVSGRLMATDQEAELDEDPFDSESRRVFRRMAHDGIQFVEWEPTGLLKDRTAGMADTDNAGAFTAMVIPGIHGVTIPTMTDYTGHNIEFGNTTAGQSPHNGPWPYPDNWPHNFIEEEHHGTGLSFSSDCEYRLNLFVHAHHIHVYGQVRTREDPFGELILYIGEDGEVFSEPYNHLMDAGAMVELSGPVSGMAPIRPDGLYLFKNLTPGSYSITLDHTDYTPTPVNLTIAPWQAPGVIPATAPFTPAYFFPGIAHDTGVDGFLYLDWNTTGTIGVLRFNYDTDLMAYQDAGTSAPDYFSMDSLPGRVFSYTGFHDFVSGIPSGDYRIWENFGGWFTECGAGSQVFNGAYEGGNGDTTPPTATPTSGRIYQLDLRAVSSSDRTVAVPNVQADFGGGVVETANQLLMTHNASPRPQSVTHTGNMWQQSFQFSPIIEVIDPKIPLVRTTLFMDRLMTVSGTVQSGGQPLSSVTVSVRNRFGVQVASGMTDAQGGYSIGNILAQNVYVAVGLRGFIPQRRRHVIPGPDNPDVTANFSLLPVSAPTVDGFTMNRFGAFLPGVSKAGDAFGFDPNAARGKLTVTWKANAVAMPFSMTLDGFEQADGSLADSTPVMVDDPIVELWVIDRRAFKEPFVNSSEPTDFETLTAPSPLNLRTVNQFLDPIKKGEKDGEPYLVFHRCYGAGTEGPQYEGKLPLWELPPGVFRPMLLAITAAGGVKVIDYATPQGKPSLQGINLPQWAATIMEIVGVGANGGSLTQEVTDGFGGGFLKGSELQPNLEARIGLLPEDNELEDDSALSYKYVLGVNVELGEKPGSLGPISFGPEFFGLQLSGWNAEFEVAGEDKVATLAVVPSVSKDISEAAKKARDKNYKPPVVTDDDDDKLTEVNIETSGKVGGFVELDSDPLGNNRFSKLGYVLEAQSVVDGFFRWDATPIVEKMAYVGPIVKGINSSGLADLKTYGRLEFTFGGKATYNAQTVYPQPGTGISQTGEQPLAFDMLGSVEHSLAFTMILRVAVGLELAAKGKGWAKGFGKLNGKGLLQLGAPTGASDTDGVFIAFNLIGEGNWIDSITGAGSVVLGIEAQALTRKWKKKFQYDIVKFVLKFGEDEEPGGGAGTQGVKQTDPTAGSVFVLTPMNVTFVEINASTAPAPRFVGDNRMLVDDFFEAGSYNLSADGELLVYTGTDPATGEMTIMASLKDGESWSGAIELVRAGGIGSVTSTQLSDGRRLIVWSEIATEDVSNPFPSTTLRYVLSNPAGDMWSQASDIGLIAQVSFDLRLVAMGTQAALTFRCTAEGPFADNCSLHSAIWDGAAWGALTELLPNQPLLDHDLTSNGVDKALVIAATEDGRLLDLTYTGGMWSGAGEVAVGVSAPVSASRDGANGVAVLWQDDGESLNLSRYDCASKSWTHVGPVVNGALTSDARILALESEGLTVYLLTWLQGSDTTRLWHSFVATDGTTLMPRREIGITDTGVHSEIRLARNVGHRATVFTHFMADSSSLRSYPVGLPMAGDCNGNGIDDAVEIAGGQVADLNNNGVPDACEIADGMTMDRNRNGIPDESEEAPAGDLNRNGFADMNEIFLGLLTDGNGNTLPDEFELFPRTLPFDRNKPEQFYRARRIIIRQVRANDVDMDVQGTMLEKADRVTGPWMIVE